MTFPIKNKIKNRIRRDILVDSQFGSQQQHFQYFVLFSFLKFLFFQLPRKKSKIKKAISILYNDIPSPSLCVRLSALFCFVHRDPPYLKLTFTRKELSNVFLKRKYKLRLRNVFIIFVK